MEKRRIPRVDRPRVKLFLEMVDTSLKSVAVRSLFPCVHSLQSLRFESNVIRTIQFHCVSEKEIYGEQKQQFFYFDLVVYALFLSTLIVGFFQACSKLPSWNTFFTSIQMDKEKKKNIWILFNNFICDSDMGTFYRLRE